jgi:RNA polymerase sigma factor (sigma-70 family)
MQTLSQASRNGRQNASRQSTQSTAKHHRYFKTPQEIEDIVQEAFVKVIEAKQHRKIEHPKAYMYQTVKNLSLNRIAKSDYRLTDTIGDAVGDTAYGPVLQVTATMEEQFESRERFELFCRAVRQLPIKCQRVYIMRRVYGYSQKEIAEKMDISIKTVEAHLTKAIVRCTDFMDEVENQDDHNSDSNGHTKDRDKTANKHKSRADNRTTEGRNNAQIKGSTGERHG